MLPDHRPHKSAIEKTRTFRPSLVAGSTGTVPEWREGAKQLHAVPSSRPSQASNNATIRLVLASDYPTTRLGLESIFRREPGFDLVACGASRQDLSRAISTHTPDIVILEQEEAQSAETLVMLRQIRNGGGTPRIILLTAHAGDDSLPDAVRPGVDVALSKTVLPEVLVQCVREVYGGRHSSRPGDNRTSTAASPVNGLAALTRRQIEVVRAAASGLSNKELGALLGVSEGTIKNHLHAIYERLQLDGRLALLLYAKDSGIPLTPR